MILKIFPFENEINIEEHHIAILYVQDKTLFNRLANSFYQLTNGQDGQEKIILVENDKILNIQDSLLFLPDLWGFDYNNKKILNKLAQYIERHYKLDAEEMEAFQKQVQLIQLGVQEIINELPFQIDMKSAILIPDILKMLGIKIGDMTHATLLERALAFIEIIQIFELCETVVFVNLKNYFNNKEINELYRHAIHYKIKIMILEYGTFEEKLPYEKVWLIDEDYDEFTY